MTKTPLGEEPTLADRSGPIILLDQTQLVVTTIRDVITGVNHRREVWPPTTTLCWQE